MSRQYTIHSIVSHYTHNFWTPSASMKPTTGTDPPTGIPGTEAALAKKQVIWLSIESG